MLVRTKLITDGNVTDSISDGELIDNKLIFNDNGNQVSFDLDNDILIRETDAIRMECHYKKGYRSINRTYVKEFNNYVDIDINTSIMDKTDNFIDIEYTLLDSNSVIRYIINYGG